MENHQPLITQVWTQVSLCISKMLTYIQYLLHVAMSSITKTSKRKPCGRRYCICWASIMHLSGTIRHSTGFYWLTKGIASAQSAEQKEDKKVTNWPGRTSSENSNSSWHHRKIFIIFNKSSFVIEMNVVSFCGDCFEYSFLFIFVLFLYIYVMFVNKIKVGNQNKYINNT